LDAAIMSRRPQQAAAIPFRRNGNSVSLCLITAAASQSWGIPKGTIERGRSSEDTALQEAWQEAGLRGRILGESLGSYEYEKAGVLLTVAVYLMEVEIEAKHWEEQELRRRRWVPARDAARILKTHPAWSLVEEACRRLTD
jgi:8-oxo-dGTP pyrophosphatase MutT (NUDIX family)